MTASPRAILAGLERALGNHPRVRLPLPPADRRARRAEVQGVGPQAAPRAGEARAARRDPVLPRHLGRLLGRRRCKTASASDISPGRGSVSLLRAGAPPPGIGWPLRTSVVGRGGVASLLAIFDCAVAAGAIPKMGGPWKHRPGDRRTVSSSRLEQVALMAQRTAGTRGAGDPGAHR